MSPRKLRLLEDKALRDAAKLNVLTDVELIKSDMDKHGPAQRISEAGIEYLRTLGEGALDIAHENKGTLSGGLAIGLAGIAAWMFRDNIMDLIDGFLEESENADAEPVEGPRIADTDADLPEQTET